MRDTAFGIIKVCQITGTRLLQEVYGNTLGSLLVSVAQQGNIEDLEHRLGEARTVNSEHRTAAPEIPGIEEPGCNAHQLLLHIASGSGSHRLDFLRLYLRLSPGWSFSGRFRLDKSTLGN